MTRMIESLAARPAAQRIPIAIVLSILGLFLAGLAAGVIGGAISTGHLPRRMWVLAIPFVAAPAAYVLLKAAWRLTLPPQSASGYEKRYWRMWLVVSALGIPIGALLAFTSSPDDLASLNPFGNEPIAAPIALLLAVLVTGFFAAAVWLYHRTIDDHEERAYLWGSQLAYYFLVLALPAWWLLERGGIVGPFTATVALIAILISFIVQAIVWAWLKFR